MNNELILKLAQTHDSFYLYDETMMLERIGRLKAAFPGVQFLYSVKANPHPGHGDDAGLRRGRGQSC